MGQGKKAYQSLILLPYLVSSVIVGYLVFAFLSVENGFVNNAILPLFGKEGINWYSEPKYWPFILVLSVHGKRSAITASFIFQL